MKFQTMIQDSALLEAIDKLGWQESMPIQEAVIPHLLARKNVVLQAKTGSGKTGAYLLPALQQIQWEENAVQCLVLAPTRELALQIKEESEALGKYKRIKCVNLIGKVPMSYQEQDLKQKCHIVAGTPGRVLDHLQRGNLPLDQLQYVILDEADEMCRMGFLETIQEILEEVPETVTRCLCSATIEDAIDTLCEDYLTPYERIVLEEATKWNMQIQNDAYEVAEEEKEAFLWKLLLQQQPSSAIVFTTTRDRCESVYRFLRSQMKEVAILHGAMEQPDREVQLERFRYGKAQILVASDVAARGLDIEQVDLVINLELPQEKERFVHRAGRSGRKDQPGHVISLISPQEKRLQEEIEEYANTSMQRQDRKEIDAVICDEASIEQLRKKRVRKQKKTKALTQDILRLYIHGGKKKKIRAGDLVGAICQIDGIDAEDIGVIQVQDLGSYVEILHGKGQQVYRALQKKSIKNKQLKVEISHKQG